LEREAKKTLTQGDYLRVKVLCLDKITPHKGHGPYSLISSAPELGIVLDVLKDRKKPVWKRGLRRAGRMVCGSRQIDYNT
jgi:hypothetical protein